MNILHHPKSLNTVQHFTFYRACNLYYILCYQYTPQKIVFQLKYYSTEAQCIQLDTFQTQFRELSWARLSKRDFTIEKQILCKTANVYEIRYGTQIINPFLNSIISTNGVILILLIVSLSQNLFLAQPFWFIVSTLDIIILHNFCEVS